MGVRASRSAAPWIGLVLSCTLVAVALPGASVLGAVALLVVLACHVTLLVTTRRSTRRLRVQYAEGEHLALHDPVTELPNRISLHERAHQALVTARRNGTAVGLLLLDLDRFKEVNDTLGHHNGDLLLHIVGQRLAGCLRESDCVARLGGDEFAVLLADVDGADGALLVAHRLRTALAERVELEGIGMEIEASVGVAISPSHGDDPETLLQRADVAMYVAKREHLAVALYDSAGDGYSRDRLALVADLRRAIADGELVLHFQPKATVATRDVTGVEALVRWQHPTRGLLFPDAFIPIAEHTGLMRPLTSFVLDHALEQCSRWHRDGHAISVAVNISTRNLLDLALPEEIAGLLERHDLPAAALELEITETTIMSDPPRAQAVLRRLGELGVSLAIDDFGTGYTSLSWLRSLPVTTLKIDKSFVLHMVDSDEDAVIVRSTVQLGRSLGLHVVAEGVEDNGAWEALEALGCDTAQGYFLSRPQPAEVLTPWLASRPRPAARTASMSVSTGGLSAELTA